MAYQDSNDITFIQNYFLAPSDPIQRQYEALRAFYLGNEKVGRGGSTFWLQFQDISDPVPSSPKSAGAQVLSEIEHGRKPSPHKNEVHDLIVGMRKKYYSVYDIQFELEELGHRLTPMAISEVLRAEGFARLPRARRRSTSITAASTECSYRRCAAVPVDAPALSLKCGWTVSVAAASRTARSGRHRSKCKLPGTRMIPATHAIRSALALKLASTERRSHVTDLIFDEGMALLTGLNALPKKSYLSRLLRQARSPDESSCSDSVVGVGSSGWANRRVILQPRFPLRAILRQGRVRGEELRVPA